MQIDFLLCKMSDLIDFDSPNTENIVVSLQLPLIPVPESLRNNEFNANEAGPSLIEPDKRRSMENNPFDTVMKKIIDYERNKEDPFETVTQKAKEFKNESGDAFISQSVKYSDILKMNKISEETENNVDVQLGGENDLSIISDLNNTNLISDSENQVLSLLNCDNKIPKVHISSNCCTDLSILSISSMNDSLLNLENNNVKGIKNLPVDLNARFKSMSQINFLSNNKFAPQTLNRRSMSTSDAVKNNTFLEDYLLNSAHSSVFEDPFNNAFRKSSLRSASSNSSYLSNQFDLSKNLERQNTNSSVTSGLSNVSSIPYDPSIKIRHDRLCSESSTFSGISNLSTISGNNIVSSSDSSVFSNDTLNKGFITSRIQVSSSQIDKSPLKSYDKSDLSVISNDTLNKGFIPSKIQLTNSLSDKSPLKSSDKSDLIKKFFEIKTQISASEKEESESKNEKDSSKIKSNSFLKPNISQKEENQQNSDEMLIDIDGSFNSVFNDNTGINDIISQEAKLLAETFEKMASSEESNYPPEDDLLSKIQLNFDSLPISDDEAVDDLIDLPVSPTKDVPKLYADTDKVQVNGNESLAKNLIATLNKIVNEKNEIAAVEILRGLGTVLSMTTELETKNIDNQVTNSKIIKQNTPIKLHRSSNSLYKSPSTTNVNTKNTSFEVLPLRRSVSTNPIYNYNLLDNSFLKNKRKSELLNIKKRFPSDPGFENLVMGKTKNEIPVTMEEQFNLKISKAEQVKTKFKKKLNSEIVTKKGPLKAIIPLGNMQKRGSTNPRVSLHNITPPKPLISVPPLNIVSSTPNTSGIIKNSQSQPTASSTPNIKVLKTPQTNVQKQRNSKNLSMRNVSPVCLNSSLKRNIGTPKNISKRMERTLSPQKKSLTPKVKIDNGFECRIPKYSPRPMRVRNYSLQDLNSIKSFQNIGNSPKFSSEKKLNRQPFSSPLKNLNKLTYNKGKIVSRIGKLNNSQLGAEKENYA